MTRSFPVLRLGRIVGFAVPAERSLVFTARDPRRDDLSGGRFTTASRARRIASVVLSRECGRLPTAA